VPCKETSFLKHNVDSADGDTVELVMTRLIARESFGWCLFAVKAFSVVFGSTILVGPRLCLLFVEVSRSHAAGIPQRQGQPTAEIFIHKRQTSMLQARFEPTIPASKRSQTHALDRAATGIGSFKSYMIF